MLKAEKIEINRKMLAEFAIQMPEKFTQLVQEVVK